MRSNKMKRLILSSMIAAGMTFSAIAGEGAGNGGGAWVCQNDDQLKTIRWAKLVDLYEAEKEFQLPLKSFGNHNFHEIIDIQKVRLFSLNKNLYEVLTSYFEDVESNLREIDADLELIDDSLYRVRPPVRDCLDGEVKYIQVANYTHYGSVLINKYQFNNEKFSEIDKAALMFHEAIYAYLRDRYGDSDSVRAREIVGYLFSNLKDVEISEKIEEVIGYVAGGAPSMEFVKIPAGSFTMGSPSDEKGRDNDEQQRYVTITRDFEMMTTEVTQSMYFEVTGKNPSYFKKQEHCPDSFETRVSHITGDTEPLCPNNPVEYVSYYDVQSFISSLNAKTGMSYRLPTEAEWEYAARAGSGAAYSFGDLAEYLSEHAIYEKNSEGRTHEVGSIRTYSNLPNAFGLYDTHGNVWEYTLDLYVEKPKDVVDPLSQRSVFGSPRVIRGGGWGNNSANDLRSANRSLNWGGFGTRDIGFRLVRSLE